MLEERKKRFSSVEGGPWGCVVVLAAFCIQVLAFGTSQSIGVYNIELLRYFKTGAMAISLVGSINLGVFLGAGPLASVLMTRWSHRQVALLGAVLCNIGLITMPFAPNLEYMYAFYGVLSGLGYCLVYVPSHVLSGLYFLKHRSLATGIATAGSGMGAAVFPVVMFKIIDYYGWRGSLYIVSGLNLHLLIFAALLRPVPKKFLKTIAAAEELQTLNVSKKRRKSEVNGCETENITPVNGQISNCDCNEIDTELDVNSTMLSADEKLGTYARLRKHFLAVFTIDFIIYWFSNICWNAGGAIVLIFFPEYAYSAGLSKENASITYTMAGAGSCIGCVLGGMLGNIKYFNRIGLYIGGNFGAGIVTLLLTLKVLHTFAGLFMISLVFGLMFGIILGLLVVVTSDLLGTEALGDGFGYLMFANGIGVFSGPPLAGLLIDMYGDEDLAMYLSGILTCCGGLTMCGVYVRKKLCGSRVRKEITINVEL
ncbi:monocarboxylate transporter 14-like isoform X1 [Ruditapes philippinarum]|uniref:monocarboxylate transporter 14-like isoform X1 n=1 Tax=Ruditapes philippinarum TaxID=129788 RepID=UPI00295BFEC8|nr:monocarboxylate transporter 14-like isoform X1 [Ruditapes philippinarum]XP_060568130.1 monocarboxylate transporter 14-like isoform X1 [Ruditapes philippinarum]